MKTTTLFGLVTLVSGFAFAGATTPVELIKEVRNVEQEALVADSFGKTLYVFDPDQGQAAPKCAGDCAEVWPPYLVNAGDAAGLIPPLATIDRANGKKQLTYKGRPVYTYIFDRTVGDDKGDGLGGVWHYIEAE